MKKLFGRIAAAAALLICSSVVMISTPAVAQSGGLGDLLGGVSDSALDKLAQPGAFFNDESVRIPLPGLMEKAAKLLRFTSDKGLTKDLAKSMNDVASLAAAEAKPLFREAINGLSLKDGIDIGKSNNGATDYLRESSEGSLSDKIRPLVSKAMGDSGTLDQLNVLSSNKIVSKLGISSDSVTDHVTEKTMDGIFKYMAAEESKVRKNPLKAIGSVLGIK